MVTGCPSCPSCPSRFKQDRLKALGGCSGFNLDGHHRARACAELGKDPFLKEYGGNYPAGYVLSSNLHRRHLSASQRAGAIVACNEWRGEGRVQLGNVAELPNQLGTSAQFAPLLASNR